MVNALLAGVVLTIILLGGVAGYAIYETVLNNTPEYVDDVYPSNGGDGGLSPTPTPIINDSSGGSSGDGSSGNSSGTVPLDPVGWGYAQGADFIIASRTSNNGTVYYGCYNTTSARWIVEWTSLNASYPINQVTKLDDQKIVLGSGTFTLTSSIINDLTGNNNTLEGLGDATVLKVADNTNITAIAIAQASGWNIKNLLIDGNSANNNQGGGNGYLGSNYGEDNGGDEVDMYQNAIHIFNSSNCRVQNVHVKNTVMHSINIHFTNWTTVEGCTVENAGKGTTYYTTHSGILVWNYAFYNTVIDNNVINPYYTGIYNSFWSKENTIQGNNVVSNLATTINGVLILDGCQDAKVLGNTIELANVGYAVFLNDIGYNVQSRIKVSDNIIKTCERGVFITSSGTLYDVSNNKISNCTYGIEARTLNNSALARNEVFNTTYGIYMSALAAKNNIILNTCLNSTTTGITISNSSYNYCAENTLSGKKGIAIGTSATYNELKNNYIVINPAAYTNGISIQTNCASNTISGNTITGSSTWCALYIGSNTDSTLLTDNVEYACTASLIIADANCNDTIVFANRNFDDGDISNSGTDTVAFDNFDQSAKTWITAISAPTGGR